MTREHRTRVILLVACLAFPAWASGQSFPIPAGLAAADVSFRGSGGLVLHGTILTPADTQASRPGIVLLHGSGTGLIREYLLPEAEAFVRQGFAVLIYDKRSVGYSLFNRSYSQLADDALGAMQALRSHPGVDPAKVGVWGLSEGGWVAPLAASRSGDVAFVIVVGANAMQPLRQQIWAVSNALRRAGVSGSLRNTAVPRMYRLIADAGIFPEAFHDGEAVLRRIRQPLLGIWGTDDLDTPPGENPALFARALQQGGNDHYTFRFFPGANHRVHQRPDGGVTALPLLAHGYAELVGTWVADVTAGRLPSADVPPAPQQDLSSAPIPPAPSRVAVWMQLAGFVVLVVAFAGYPVAAGVRRLRRRTPMGHRRNAGIIHPARLLAGTGIVAVVGSVLYPAYVITLSTRTVADLGPVVGGRPALWLILQSLAVVATGAAVATGLGWRRVRSAVPLGERVQLQLLLLGGVVFVPWAVYWGLLLP